MPDNVTIGFGDQRHGELTRIAQRIHDEVLRVAGMRSIAKCRRSHGFDRQYVGGHFTADPDIHNGRLFEGVRRQFAQSIELQQIPQVAVQVFEHGDGAVTFFCGIADKDHALAREFPIIPPEVVGLEEQ